MVFVSILGVIVFSFLILAGFLAAMFELIDIMDTLKRINKMKKTKKTITKCRCNFCDKFYNKDVQNTCSECGHTFCPDCVRDEGTACVCKECDKK